MLTAQLPTATDAQVMTVLIGLAALMAIAYLALGLAVHVRTLRAAQPRPPEQDFLTKAEFAAFRTDVLAKIEEKDQFARREIDGLRKDLLDRVQKLDEYLHENNHRAADAVQQLLLKVERLIVADEIRHPEAAARRPPAKSDP